MYKVLYSYVNVIANTAPLMHGLNVAVTHAYHAVTHAYVCLYIVITYYMGYKL